MIWVTWRQCRIEFLVVLAILAGMVAYLVPTGLDKYQLFDDSGLRACLAAGGDCPGLRDSFTNGYNSVTTVVGWFNFAPGIAGLLLAAPLIGELEHRTYRLAWTQSVTRERWLATKLMFAICGAVAFGVLLSAVMTWWFSPLDRTATFAGKDLGESYNFEGIMPVACTLFALSLALAAGTASRRMVIAMPIALVGFVVLRVGLETVFRAGLTSDVTFEAGAGELAVNEATRDVAKFWRTQALEGGLFLLSSLLLLCFSVWHVRRHMS